MAPRVVTEFDFDNAPARGRVVTELDFDNPDKFTASDVIAEPVKGFVSAPLGLMSMIGSAGQSLWELPGNIKYTAKGLMSPYAGELARDTIDTVARGTGRTATGLAGGILGSRGGIPGMAAGASLGANSFDALVDMVTSYIKGKESEITPSKFSKGVLRDFGAGLFLPSIIKGTQAVNKTLQPLTNSGAEKTAGDILKTVGPEDLQQKLGAILPEEQAGLGKYRTTGEILDDPNLSQLEQTIAKTDLGTAGRGFKDLTLQREAARNAILDDITPSTGMNAEATGQMVGKAISAQREAARNASSNLFKEVDYEAAVPLGKVKSNVFDSFADKFGSGKVTIPAEAKGLLKDVQRQPLSTSIKEMQVLRSRALDVAKNNQGTSTGVFAQDVARLLDDGLERSLEQGGSVLNADTLLRARSTWKDMKQTYDKGPLSSILDDNTLDSKVVSKALSSPEAARAVRTQLETNPLALDALKEQALNRVIDKRSPGGMLNSGAYQKALKSNSPILKEIIGEEHLANLNAVAKDLQQNSRYSEIGNLASRGNSNTTQGLTTTALLKDRILKELGVMQPVVSKVGGGLFGLLEGKVPGIGWASNWVAQQATMKVNEAIMKAARDPSFAAKLVNSVDITWIGKSAKVLSSQIDLPQNAPATILGSLSQSKGKTPQAEDVGREQISQERTSSKPDRSKLLAALVQTESRGNPKAVSPVGAKGLGQLMDATGEEWAKKLGVKYNPFDSEQNLKISDLELERLLKKYGDEKLAIAAYNWGQGNLDKLIKRLGTRDFEELAAYLPKETRQHNERTFKNLA